MLFKFGEKVFGSMDLFRGWLHDSSIPLGGTSPISLLDTTFGIDLVHDELGRIQHGIFS
ncbi:MbcA/ParS/Xre antitoxin family protein [Belliella sp. DSM 111904]|uniref:MbcA/ParS/Xre antitoxin family protein n=1 Tax=Belliella filtrata TaxID=2923435 RepID=A0ABS9UZW8_9BACT|nr:MbcA/ParS/Xre antitoxin family protein [Belliella filtrata]MCH7409706.1 MbcA/ParS/Xre antitoxin family protein [Belliella filtrata]